MAISARRDVADVPLLVVARRVTPVVQLGQQSVCVVVADDEGEDRAFVRAVRFLMDGMDRHA